MLTATIELNERITTAHRAKLAYVYVRQSTTGQVRQHQESTELQYRLVNRAASLGWPRDRIEVIDEDLGKSGVSSEARHGFQRLIAEIGLAKAGLVLSLDASRLARNNRDWHQLLAQLAQNRGSALGKSKAYPKSRHYIFGRVAGDQALATSACCSCSARRMRFGKTMPRRSRRVACAASGWVTQRRRIWPWEAVGNTTSLD